jgi:putative phage-type endonuclease
VADRRRAGSEDHTVNVTTEVMAEAEALQERARWLEWRRGGVGGSDIAGILGLSRWSSPWSVWADKVGLRPDTESTERQRIGVELEPVLDGLFTRRTGLHVRCQQTWCIDTDAPWRRCTVDGFAYEAHDGYGPGERFEPAARFNGALGTVQHKTDYRRPWGDLIPPDIRAQCIWEMGVTRLPHCWLSVMHGGFQYEVYDIPFDAEAAEDWAYMTARADEFWQAHVLTGTAPDIDGSDATAGALRDVYPEEEPGTRAEVKTDDLAYWRDAATRRKTATRDEQAAVSRIRAALQDAEIGTVDGRAVITLRQQTRKQTCKACGHIEESEPFRVLRDAPKKLADLPAVTDVAEGPLLELHDLPAVTWWAEGPLLDRYKNHARICEACTDRTGDTDAPADT